MQCHRVYGEHTILGGGDVPLEFEAMIQIESNVFVEAPKVPAPPLRKWRLLATMSQSTLGFGFGPKSTLDFGSKSRFRFSGQNKSGGGQAWWKGEIRVPRREAYCMSPSNR